MGLFQFSFPVPPGRPVIYNERGIIVENHLGPYNEGVELILTCSVSGGKSYFTCIKPETRNTRPPVSNVIM
jgi:hypothetical protein